MTSLSSRECNRILYLFDRGYMLSTIIEDIDTSRPPERSTCITEEVKEFLYDTRGAFG